MVPDTDSQLLSVGNTVKIKEGTRYFPKVEKNEFIIVQVLERQRYRKLIGGVENYSIYIILGGDGNFKVHANEIVRFEKKTKAKKK